MIVCHRGDHLTVIISDRKNPIFDVLTLLDLNSAI
jgi:hypothetical protein